MGRPKQVYAQVMFDLRAREKMGIEKYGVSVDKAKLNTLQWMQHAYEESLDHAIYMKKLILEAHKNVESLDVEKIQYKLDENQLKLF
jgi:hypothetical protein